MRVRLWITATVCLFCAAAGDDKTYTFKESVSVGEVIHGHISLHNHSNTTSTVDAQSTTTDETDFQKMEFTATVLGAKDGSATEMRVEFTPDSYDTAKLAGQDETKTPNTFAGKTVTIRRHSDKDITNDFSGQADPSDVESLNSLLNPDEDFFPEAAVGIGDSWDVTGKLSRHWELGAKDQLIAKCRLDSIKETGGQRMAQMTCSCGLIRHEDGNVEEDIQTTLVLTVDVARSMIVDCDQHGSSTFSTPQSERTQVTGTSEFEFRGDVTLAGATTAPSTEP